LSEIWNKNKGKDLNKSGSNDKDINFHVVFEKNPSWEKVMEENIRTLVFYNIFMTPQEKKIKLKLKEQILSNLFDKNKSCPNYFNLINLSTMATSLLILKSLLTEAEVGTSLFYNKENIAHSIKYLTPSSTIFKVLSEFLRFLNPLSPEAEILSPLLLQLLSHLTTSSEPKADQEEKEEEKHLDMKEEKEEDEVDSSQEMMIDEQPEEDMEGQEDEEGEEDEGEGEDDEEIDPFIEEIATQSEELSLDDMIENLEYDEQEGDESDEDDDDVERSMGDEEMEMDEIDSDEASEMLHQMEEADVIGIIEEQDDPMDMESQQDGNEEDIIEDDQPEEGFNVIDIDQPIPHFNMRRRQLVNIGEEDDFELESNNLGFQQLLDMLHYRGGGRAGNPFRNDHRDPLERIGLAGIRGQIRRVDQRVAQRRAAGLETLYQLDYSGRRENDNDFWESNVNLNEFGNNRNRSQRHNEDNIRDPFSNLIARDIQQIRNDLQGIRGDLDDLRERINDRALFGGRGRAGEKEEPRKTNTNPFDIIK
jgi:hypothetical protein